MPITKAMFPLQLLSSIMREQGIIRNASWQIRSTGTEITLLTTGSTGSAYPVRPLADQRKNAGTDQKTEYKDNTDRIAVERAFALAKQKYGLGLIASRLEETTRNSIALSIIAMNVDWICRSFYAYCVISFFQGTNSMDLC